LSSSHQSNEKKWSALEQQIDHGKENIPDENAIHDESHKNDSHG
jgi:hypothetical protein